MRNSKYIIPLFFIVITAAIIVNIIGLFTQSIRLDESQSIWVSSKSILSILTLTSQDVHVPLYGILLHFWIQFFGSEIIIARILSHIFFLLTLFVLFKLAKESSNRYVAILTIALFSLSPFILWYSNETRMYTLFTFAVSLHHLYLLRILKSKGTSGKLGYFFSTIIGMYTHYFFFLLLTSEALFLLGLFIKNMIDDLNTKRETFIEVFKRNIKIPYGIFLLVMSSFVFLAPWLIYVISQGSASNTQPLLSKPTSFNLIQIFINFIFGFQAISLQSVLVSLWPFSVLILFFIFTIRKHIKLDYVAYFVTVTFFPIVLAFVVSYFKPIFLSRYLIFTTPTLFILIAWLILNFTKRLFSITALAILCVMFGFLMLQNEISASPVKEDYNSVSTYLAAHAKPQDIVLVTAPFTIYPIEYSYSGLAKIDTIPYWDHYKQGGIPPFDQNAFQKQLQGYSKIYNNMYVVFSYDQGYEDKIKSYLNTHYKLLKSIKYPPNIEIREYKLRYD